MTDKENHYIERDATNYLKGVALILMFVHHFFTFPDWYVDGISYPYLSRFVAYMCSPLKICVPIFAFLTGYFYYFSHNKTLRYSIRKSTDVWLSYVFVFFLLLIPAALLGVYDFSVKNVVLEVLALKRPTIIFGWYVCFYFVTMLILPLYAKLSGKSSAFCFLFFFALPTIVCALFGMFLSGKLSEGGYLQLVENFKWFPCVGTGYIFAQHALFDGFKSVVPVKSRFGQILIGFAFIAFSFGTRYFSCSDIIGAPFFIFGAMELYHAVKHKSVFKLIALIGKYSLFMWFLHCIFFNQCKEYTQPILFFPKEPILVTLWGLLLCLTAAVVVQIPVNGLLKLKNRLFKLN